MACIDRAAKIRRSLDRMGRRYVRSVRAGDLRAAQAAQARDARAVLGDAAELLAAAVLYLPIRGQLPDQINAVIDAIEGGGK